MKILKYFSVLTVTFAFFMISNLIDIPSAQAACGTYYEDNDDPNGLTYRNGFSTYSKATSSYRGDYRLSKDTSSRDFHQWRSPGGKCDGYHYYYAYLNNVNFTNTTATYNYPTTSGDAIKKIDQYNAPGGWNYVGFGYTSATIRISVTTYGPTGSKTGADGIKFVKS